MIKEELRSLFQNKILLLLVLIIALIIAIYAQVFLSSFWYSYGKAVQYPAAAVDHSRPAEHIEKVLSNSFQMKDSLKEEDFVSFEFVNSKASQEEEEGEKCRTAVTTLRDFSIKAADLIGVKPPETQLKYEIKPETNYNAPILDKTVLADIERNIAKKMTAAYTQSLFGEMQAIGSVMGVLQDAGLFTKA